MNCLAESVAQAAGVGEGVLSVVVGEIIRRAYIAYYYTLSLHGRYHLSGKAAGGTRVGALLADGAGTRAEDKRLWI